MTLGEFIQRFRAESKDLRKPYAWTDELIKSFFNAAERRACVCGRLLFEDDDSAICSIDLSAGDHTYALHDKLYEIVSLHIANSAGEMRPIDLRSREWLNANDPAWRENNCLAYAAIQRDTAIRVVGEIVAGDEMLIEGYRLPMKDMSAPDNRPEINEAHHEHLIEWALHKAFSIPDTDRFDPGRAAKHEANFTRYFGTLPDSDMRRSTRTDSVQHNEAHIF
jgi:hypothetical protein